MSHSDVMTLPVEEAQRPTAETLRRRTGRRTVGSIVATVVLSVFATLLGPLGMVSSANAAQDGDPIATWKIGDVNSYAAFINQIRRTVNVGESSVTGTGRQVFHTSGNPNRETYITVRVERSDSNRSVRLRLRASNLYLVGWWRNSHERDQYVSVDRTQTQPPVNGAHEERPGVSAPFGESYTAIERETGVNSDRGHIQYSHGILNETVETLIRADRRSTRDQAGAFLRMTQAVSEAARFRPISEYMTAAQRDHVAASAMPGYYVSMENRWSEFSRRFNQIQKETKKNPHYQDPQPLRQYVWLRSADTGRRELEDYVFNTAVSYAMYLLMTALQPVTK
ncbi:ribosome-inactivating family protein [Streptomyces sp. QTS52]